MDTPTAPFLAFLESDGTDNDDWITDHAGDPDLITWTNYTEGTEAIILIKHVTLAISAIPGNKATAMAGGSTYEYRTGARFYQFQIQGELSSRTQAAYFRKFFNLERHTEASSWKALYMIKTFAANDHEGGLVDADGNVKDYMKIHSTRCQVIWSAAAPLIYTVRIEGVSTW